MKQFYKNTETIRNDLEQGIKVFWENESYQVVLESANVPTSEDKNGLCLCVRCTSNWFGSRLDKSEVSRCFKIVETKGF